MVPEYMELPDRYGTSIRAAFLLGVLEVNRPKRYAIMLVFGEQQDL